MEANSKSEKKLIMTFNYNCDTADILDLLGWIRNFAKFRTFLISRNFANNFHFNFAKYEMNSWCEISRNFVSTLMWLSAFLIEDGAFYTEHSEYGNIHYCTLSSWSVLDVLWRGQVLHCWKVYVILVGAVAGYNTWGPDHFRPPAVVVRGRSV